MNDDERLPLLARCGMIVLHLLVTCVAGLSLWLSQFSLDGCTAASCDYAAYSLALDSFLFGAIALLVLSTAVALLVRWEYAGYAPLAATLLLLVLLAVSYSASRAAIDLPLFSAGVVG